MDVRRVFGLDMLSQPCDAMCGDGDALEVQEIFLAEAAKTRQTFFRTVDLAVPYSRRSAAGSTLTRPSYTQR